MNVTARKGNLLIYSPFLIQVPFVNSCQTFKTCNSDPLIGHVKIAWIYSSCEVFYLMLISWFDQHLAMDKLVLGDCKEVSKEVRLAGGHHIVDWAHSSLERQMHNKYILVHLIAKRCTSGVLTFLFTSVNWSCHPDGPIIELPLQIFDCIQLFLPNLNITNS